MIFFRKPVPTFRIMLYLVFADETAVERVFGCACVCHAGCRAHCALFIVDQFE